MAERLIQEPALETHRSSEDKEAIYKTLSAPIEVQVEMTTVCNNTCAYCYNYWREKDVSNRTRGARESTLDGKQISRVIDELVGNKIFFLTLTGGEPLLFKKATLDVIKRATENDIACSLNTNLTTVTKEDVRLLKQVGVDSIITSLISYDEDIHDYLSQRRGAFRQAVEGIQNVLSEGIRLRVNMVVTQANETQVYETGKFVHSLGVTAFSATKATPPPNCEDFSSLSISQDSLRNSLDQLLALHEEFNMNVDILEPYPLCAMRDISRYKYFARKRCNAGVTTCTIGATGEVRPCSHADIVYGNIFTEPLKQVWEKMSEWRDGSLVPELCLNCKFFRLCGAGCRMEAKSHGDIGGLDPYASKPENVAVSLCECVGDCDNCDACYGCDDGCY